VWRVDGQLALSRSIGDFKYDHLLSREPHVTVERLGPHTEFLILASDGLWDVISNEEAVELVRERAADMRRDMRGPHLDYHTLARDLTWEVRRRTRIWARLWLNHARLCCVCGRDLQAYVRGSTDNIGCLLVDLYGRHPASIAAA
jgi:serine/threonine protein phosphatase PrpC